MGSEKLSAMSLAKGLEEMLATLPPTLPPMLPWDADLLWGQS
jgi:hypothetical protein